MLKCFTCLQPLLYFTNRCLKDGEIFNVGEIDTVQRCSTRSIFKNEKAQSVRVHHTTLTLHNVYIVFVRSQSNILLFPTALKINTINHVHIYPFTRSVHSYHCSTSQCVDNPTRSMLSNTCHGCKSIEKLTFS